MLKIRSSHYSFRTLSLAIALLWCVSGVFGQRTEKPSAKYEEKSARINGIDLHYLDFGGKGTPLIFLQSFHGDAKEWVDYDFIGLAPSFDGTNRVLAITRRGWGRSKEDQVRNLDVAVNGEDIVSLMNSLGLQKAVFLGRIPGNMDMTWLAEHHPERVVGLIYIGLPDVALGDTTDPDIKKLDNALFTLACDLGSDSGTKTRQRVDYVPHFIDDPSRRMNIPALLFQMVGETERPSRRLSWFGGIMAAAKDPKFKVCDAGATEYFIAAAKDAWLQKKLREELIRLDRTMDYRNGFNRAFGSNLKIVTEPKTRAGLDTDEQFTALWRDLLLPFYVSEITSFLSKIK